jgi:CheY-like chemotaxis protein
LVTGRKLLLADDSATIQKVVGLTFRDEGLEVITVSDGRQAVEMLEEVAPDIVLADVFMPGLNGYEVCEHIKRNERFRHIPVMLLVGSFEPFDEAEARRVGADDYLTKPFQSIRTLIGKVGNLLSGGGGSASSKEATTRKLAPPPEAEKENRPDEEFIKRSTADTAPLNQHEREAMEQGSTSRSSTLNNSREVSFADLSMDDQMIKATPAEDYSGGGRGGRDQTEREAHTSRQTAQYSTTDLKDAGITHGVESARVPEPSVTAYAPAQAVMSEPLPAVNQSQAAAARSGKQASEDSLLDLGEMEPPQAQAEADDFFLDLLDEAPRQAQTVAPPFAGSNESGDGAAAVGAAHAETSSAVEQLDASARADYEEETFASAPQAQEFVDGQVLDEDVARENIGESAQFEAVASPASEAVAEYQPDESAPAPAREESFAETWPAPTERLPEGFRVEETQAVMTGAQAMTDAQAGAAASSPASTTGQITLEQLSPEVIDAIARRVVEQMSERVVEQIAWEVVPDLAERLVKRRLSEEKQ